MTVESEMQKDANHRVRRNEPVEATEIECLRSAVGWEKLENKYDRILANSYTHFTVRADDRLIGFANVISDGICDAFLVDLIVHPNYQRHGLGRVIVERAVADLTADGIKCIQVTFNPEHESFYRDCGFHIFKAGIIDNDHREA
jgi:N-acetylglutamate synthase-like GNAT family acetyltransferase